MKTLGEQVKTFREDRGWNTAEMAKAAHTSRQNIESLEAHGNRIPKYLGALAAAMGTSADEMLQLAGLAPRGLVVMPFSRSASGGCTIPQYGTGS